MTLAWNSQRVTFSNKKNILQRNNIATRDNILLLEKSIWNQLNWGIQRHTLCSLLIWVQVYIFDWGFYCSLVSSYNKRVMFLQRYCCCTEYMLKIALLYIKKLSVNMSTRLSWVRICGQITNTLNLTVTLKCVANYQSQQEYLGCANFRPLPNYYPNPNTKEVIIW